jgi:nicotinate dehydrogenase subunit A
MKIEVNGTATEVAAHPDTPLLYVLRNELGLVGTRFGCGSGECGACFVLVDDRPMASCDLPLWSTAGKKVTTIEGLTRSGELHPVQKALVEEQAAQCGYCMTASSSPPRRFWKGIPGRARPRCGTRSTGTSAAAGRTSESCARS